MFVRCFNEGVGVISELTGVSYEPEKGIRCYNIKASLFNLATLSLISGIALSIFSNPLTGLAICTVSLVAKVFIHIAMNQTFLGCISKENGNFFYKRFLSL